MATPIDRASTPPGSTRQWVTAYLAPAALCLLSLTLNLYQLESKSLWYDEMQTLAHSGWRGSWIDAISLPLTNPIFHYPPLWYLITYLPLKLGDRVFLLRLPAAWVVTLTVPVVYALGRTLFNRQVGLLGAFLLAIAPLQIRYAQEARMYAMLSFSSILALYLFWRAIRAREACWWVGFALAEILALYTHQFALLPVGVMVLFACWSLMYRRDRARFPFRGWHLVAAVAGIVVAWAPLAPFLLRDVGGHAMLSAGAAPDWTLPQLAGVLRVFSGGTNLGAVVYASLFALGAALLAIRRDEVLVLSLLWIVLPVLLVVVLPFSRRLFIRYFLFALPVYLLVVAVGLQSAIQWLAARLRLVSARGGLSMTEGALRIVGACALVGLLGINAPSIAAYYGESKQNWRDATWIVQNLAQPGDKIFVRTAYHQAGVLFYGRLRPDRLDLKNEASVLVIPTDSGTGLPVADDGRAWLLVPSNDTFQPESEFDVKMLPHHRLLEPVVFRSYNKPQDGGLIAPTSLRSVAVVPVVPQPLPTVRFWADEKTVTAGGCTWLRWEVENVRAVYVDGEGVVGHDARRVCPSATARYRLEAIDLDGKRISRTVEIEMEGAQNP